ncbi:hypothetical protein E1263_33500 [Kribbella antibiotica]|uniref:Uncharacterized protein n=1 Tax=Kribbella antibiotica TaxID=190195 RepID=A0A4V2YLW2_9ACTN|nr:hypothetical protein [Kribbella antibiotica]TDD48277.1 hypothetical protein E1263_33500 [Kribbella antibiotica]
MDFEEAADQLYASPAADFIATRNELAKELKADGDQLASTRLKALRKPTVAAWVTNLVARELGDDLDDLLALGDEFREATADMDGARLRELTPRRHQLVDKLVAEAKKLADQKLSADVTQKLRETLDAALVDPAAGDAVREGRLSSALRHVGFGVVDENGEPTNVTPLTDERREAARARRKTQQDETTAEAEQDRAQREAEEREAAARAEAKKEFEAAVTAAQAAEARVEDLDKQLDDARDALAEAQQLVHNLGAELDEARRTARDAQKESREARKRYNRM